MITIMLRNKFLYILIALGFAFVSCSKEDGGGGGGGTDDGDVSQYEARKWDGVKRAGVFYEIFVRSFADSNGDGIGDLRGITAKLDYLNELGVAGIWLTPINPSPSYHGYDVEDYTAVNPDYGTMTDFEQLVSRAHALNIKVVLDFVINHTSKTHPWFVSACTATDNPYRDYFLFAPSGEEASWISSGKVPMTDYYDKNQWHSVEKGTTGYKYFGGFSSWMPDLNYGRVEDAENSAAFKAVCDAGRFWIGKGADGFRIDAAKHIYQNEKSDENPKFLEKFYGELQKSKSDLYMIGEVYSEHNEAAPYYLGLPALFDFSSWWRLAYAINNSHAKWYPKDLLEYQAEYAAVRTDYIQATKLSNHDEDRTRTTLGGSIDRAKMAAAILLTVSGSPYIYYGEELGMLGSKSGGDEHVRDPFLWDVYAKDAYRTTWHTSTYSNEYTISVLARQEKDRTSIYRLYRKFMELRNTYPALARGTMSLPDGFTNDDGDKNFMVFYREYGSEKLFVIHNVSASEAAYTVNHSLKPIADQGRVTVTQTGTGYKITMPAYSSLICEF